ncbi:MAG: peptidyl-prolyl cis-trans isomerase [Victivallaceae bacterium]|nr:peptidyl-prolyl cis-trans isomerase [Victivallaceae bacterium]
MGKFLINLCMLLLFSGLCGQEMPQPSYHLEKPSGPQVDSILASVNGEPISLLDVIYESSYSEARLYAVYSSSDIFQEIQKLRKRILDEIIDRKLILLEYNANKPFEVPRQYVENLIDELAMNFGCTNRAELVVKAKEAGTTVEELREKARIQVINQIMISNYIYTVVNLTPREIHEYYKKNVKEFSSAPQVRLQLLLVRHDREDFKRIKAELTDAFKNADGKIFTGMVRLYSSGPGAMRGGDLGWIEYAELRPEFAKAVKGRKTGEIVGPIDTDEGIYFLRINERKGAVKAEFSRMIPEIKGKIEDERRKKAYDAYIAKLRKKSVIRYFF